MSSGPNFWEGFWEPKWRQKSLKFMFKKQLAFRSVFWYIFCDSSYFWKSAGEDMYHFFVLILHRFFVDFLLISNPSKPEKSCSREGGSTIFTKSMFSLRVQKSIQKPSKFGLKNPWKFEHRLCQLKVKMLHFWNQKAIKMRSKILENQVRSGQLSSGHVFGPLPARWSGGRGWLNVIVGCVHPVGGLAGGRHGTPRVFVFPV